MTKFAYAGQQGGRKVRGELEAGSPALAHSILRRRMIKVVKLTRANTHNVSKPRALNIDITWGPFGDIPAKVILIFTKKLATMVRAGLPILDGLAMIANQTKNKNMKNVIDAIVADLNDGRSLSAAFARHERHFDNVYRNMINAGEIAGALDKFIDRLVAILTKQQKIRAGIRSAMFYPVTLIVVSVGITAFMLFKVVPTFEELYAGIGVALPAPTQAIVSASHWISTPKNIVMILGWSLGIVIFHRIFVQYLRFYRYAYHGLLLHLPLFGDLIVKATIARAALLMANLFTAGVSVLETLTVASSVTHNTHFINGFIRVRHEVLKGTELSTLFARERAFPIEFSQLLAVGERTGNMDEMLTAIATYYEEEFDSVVEGLSTIIEPIMIVFVGALIGALVVALYLPIFSAGDLAGST